jgi:hypothetical protein
MLIAWGRNKFMAAMRLILVMELAFLWVACQTAHPLREEFSKAVLARQPAILDQPATADGGAVERFIQQHGREALPLYRQVIERFRHTTHDTETLEFAAAVEGLAAVEGASSVAQLRELALDAHVPAEVADAVLYQLKKISEDDAIRVVGELLLTEESASRRLSLVSFLRETSNPGAIPVLNRALEHELDSQLREEMKLVTLVLQNPNVCQLTHKKFGEYSSRGEWWCNYRCPGPQPTFVKNSPEECPQTAPRPIMPFWLDEK